MDSQLKHEFTDPTGQYELRINASDQTEQKVKGEIKQIRTGLQRSFELDISVEELEDLDKNEVFEMALQSVNRQYDYPFAINS